MNYMSFGFDSGRCGSRKPMTTVSLPMSALTRGNSEKGYLGLRRWSLKKCRKYQINPKESKGQADEMLVAAGLGGIHKSETQPLVREKSQGDDASTHAQARRTSVPSIPRDQIKGRKNSSIGQHGRSLTPMTDTSDDEDAIDSKPSICEKCNKRRVSKHEREQSINGNCVSLSQEPSPHSQSHGTAEDMAFSAIMMGGGGGKNKGILHSNNSRVNLEDADIQDICRCPHSSSLKQKCRETVILNVGGQPFETYKSTLKRLKTCKLAREVDMRRYYREAKGDYFFDRDPQAFSIILNYLRTGELHLPTYMCGPALQREFEYWGIEEMDIERCCWQPYNTWKTQNRSLEKLEYDRKRSTTQNDIERDKKSANCWKRTRAKVWTFLQDPNSSCCAKIYAWISIIFVFLSIFSFCAETHPDFQVHPREIKGYEGVYDLFSLKESIIDTAEVTSDPPPNLNNSFQINDTKNSTNEEVHYVPHPALVMIDLLCVSFFTIEFVTRFVFCPRKIQFITALQNIIDFIAIVPDYVEFIIHAIYPSETDMPFMDFIVILRMLRLCRIFRLIRHVPGLWILLYTLKASFNELLLMFVFLLIGMVVFASLIHFAEAKQGFGNIPIGFWWSVVTMTTVGYGDIFPTTALGYIIGSLCAISGLLMIAFTVPIIVSNFVLYYTHVQYGIVRHEREKTQIFETHADDEENCVEHVTVESKESSACTEPCFTIKTEVSGEFDSEHSTPKSTDGNCNKLE